MQSLKTTILSLTLAAGVGAVAHAQNAAPAPSFSVPQAFNGYSQPEIKDCKTVSATKRTCTVPAMTAGYYIISGLATATSTGANATEVVELGVGNSVCAAIRTGKPFTGSKQIAVGCQTLVLTDQPLTITAVSGVQDATADPKGVTLNVQRAPWPGFMSSTALRMQSPQEAAAGKAAAKPAPDKK